MEVHRQFFCLLLLAGYTSLTFAKTIKSNGPSIGVIGARFGKGQRKVGVEDGPTVIRGTGFMLELQDDGFNVEEYGDLVPGEDSDNVHYGPHGERNYFEVLRYNKRLSKEVRYILSKNDMCITLGGDHTISIGTVRGHANLNQDHQVKLLWIDAHTDVHSGESSSSKNMHGMPVRFLLDSLTSNFDDLPNPTLRKKDVVWISLRSVDGPEQEYLDQHKDLKYFTMEDVREQGIDSIIKQSLEWLQPGPETPLHMSFDIDALDPTIAPSTGTPVKNGLTMSEGRTIVQQAYNTGYLRGLDITEVNPALGSKVDAHKTAAAAHDLLVSISDAFLVL